ncbi:MAG TPA: aminotransferase class V-fold PLP-dependent enzyme, partial [Thermomicrobiales bacterium]|nr:aminotransferase class V-fold PLP-dependent enzyme [Thermomicrobiales bacterium]
LDHATVSPMPARTAAVLAERVATLQDPSRESGQREAFAAEARQRLGRLMNVPAAQVALLTNLAEAMAIVANGLSWWPGDEVVLPEQEFSSLVYPWLHLERFGVRVVFVPKSGPATELDRIAAAISPRTRVVAVSHVEFQNGFRHDMEALGRLCADRGVVLAVDVTQSLGVLPVDARAWQADVVAAHGYKWLMAMHGIAVMYVSEAAMARIQPTVPGRSSVTGGFESLDYALNWHPDARRYQSGGPNWLGAAAVASSLSLTEEIGIDRAAAQATSVADVALSGLRELPVRITTDPRSTHRSQIVSFTTGTGEGDKAIVSAGKEAGVYLGRRGMGVRVAAHYWNSVEDADKFLELVSNQVPPRR